jgi:hypothetical protein
VYKRDFDLSYISWVSSELKPRIIILTASDKELLNRKKDELVNPEELSKINKKYQQLALQMNWPVIDTSDIESDKVCSLIIDRI